MTFFKRIIIKTVDFLLLVTSGVLKFLLKVQLKMKNKQPDYYANLRSSLEKELTSDLMPLESKYKEEVQRSSARESAMRAFREDIAKLSNVKTEDYETLRMDAYKKLRYELNKINGVVNMASLAKEYEELEKKPNDIECVTDRDDILAKLIAS